MGSASYIIKTFLKLFLLLLLLINFFLMETKKIFFYKKDDVHLRVALGGTSAHSHSKMLFHQNASCVCA